MFALRYKTILILNTSVAETVVTGVQSDSLAGGGGGEGVVTKMSSVYVNSPRHSCKLCKCIYE